MKLIMMEFKSPIKMSKIGKKMSPPIPLVIRIITNLIREWNLLSVSLGIRILILNSIGKKIILDYHWFKKDEETINWREGFQYFHWTRGTSSKRRQGGLPRKRSSCVFFGRKRKRMSVREKD
jgi:hypothetical protein